MEKNETSAIPGSPGLGRAPKDTAFPNTPMAPLGSSPLTEQKLPHATFGKPSVIEKPVKETEELFEEYCEDHPYIQIKTKNQTYSFHCRIKNYNDPLEE